MSDWRKLLQAALPALDEVYGRTPTKSSPDWTIGGGAAIAIVLDHRETADIDIFIQNGTLKRLTPARNAAAGVISDTFQWPGTI